MIEKAGIQPNIDTFTYVILAFGMTKDVVEAQRWFEVYRNSSEPNGDGPYTSLISAYVSCNNATSALKVITQILAEDRIPMQSVHLVAFLRALLDAREYRNILDWRTRLLPGTPTASKYPPLTPAIKDIFFEAAVALRVRYRLIKDVFPTPSAPDASERTPSGLVLSEFGTWNLVFQQNEDAGLATLRVFLLDAGHRIAVPPLRKFMEAVLQLMPAKPSSGVPVMRRDLEVLAMARHRGIKGDEFRGLC
ncbi:hypothetical protein BC830DRAFT_781873 [Chytriomyces sp. MP71]|nr:hypothetical protein BC830DRAFT_781873 [Chytriomyces sp. MP71]